MSERQYHKWNQEEKDKLIMKITQFQHKNQKLNWLEIQECIGNKTIRQCYDQYVLLFRKPHKTDTRHIWTVQEERKLVKAFKQNPYQWENIQGLFPELNLVQLKNKINMLIRQQQDDESVYKLQDKYVYQTQIKQDTTELKILAGQLSKLLGM
ncbi:Myb-like_DNA-binding domain-containing protein [Hexamita inflata]|uniref:Myb-like DNA-binding domain-containing protein n=1 Tax=Hexamita inflata TaxID=28002 RepID=A0AA86NVM7_9EUKA|nr:Myb-like DNA-binding domain-containing protein [Hexamita inflata]